MILRQMSYPWREDHLIELDMREFRPPRLPRVIRRCQTRHRTVLIQEFFFTQGVKLLGRPELVKRGWTRRMVIEQLRERRLMIRGIRELYSERDVLEAESRPETADLLRRNLEARRDGGWGRQGSITSLQQAPDPRSKRAREQRGRENISRLMSGMPEAGGQLWSRPEQG